MQRTAIAVGTQQHPTGAQLPPFCDQQMLGAAALQFFNLRLPIDPHARRARRIT